MAIISPPKDGEEASNEQETRAEPAVENTIPLHAVFPFDASIIAPGTIFAMTLLRQRLTEKNYIHLPSMKGGEAKIRLNGEEWPLKEATELSFPTWMRETNFLRVEWL